MRTRDFINKYCKACDLFSEGDGCDAKWEDEVCGLGLEKYHGKRMIDRIEEYLSKKYEKRNHPKKANKNKKDPIKLTEAQFENHIHFPQPNFAYVIYVHDEEDDAKNIWIDSVWTNETDAIDRMKRLEQMENAILDMDTSKKYPYRYRLFGLYGYSKKHNYPEGMSIWREDYDGTIYDYKYSIHCEKAFFNNSDFLKPFNPDEYKALIKKVKGK